MGEVIVNQRLALVFAKLREAKRSGKPARLPLICHWKSATWCASCIALCGRLRACPRVLPIHKTINYMRPVMTTSSAFTPLTKQAVADSLGISIRSVENWINDGTLPAPAKLGNRVYWHPDVYFGWLSRRLQEAQAVESEPAPAELRLVPTPAPSRREASSSDKAASRLRASTERKLARLQGLN